MARGANVARGRCDGLVGHRWHGHVAGATQVRAGAWLEPCGKVGAGIWRVHGLVGLS